MIVLQLFEPRLPNVIIHTGSQTWLDDYRLR